METQELIENFEFLGDWEERYRYIIELGKRLPPFPPEQRLEANKVRGCQSQVWLILGETTAVPGALTFLVDSDAHIVRGLLAIVMTMFNEKAPGDILTVDVAQTFSALGLEQHLSPSRANGLHSIVNKIQDIARTRNGNN